MIYFYYYFLFINILSFFIFGIDKYKAKKGKNRISEKTLFIISLIGGCYGSIFAMNIFSHKTKKVKFTIINYSLLVVYSFIILKVFV